MTQEPYHIIFCIDGFTLKKVNDFYRHYHPFHSSLNFVGLRNWARKQALRLFEPPQNYAVMECHYYHPYKDPRTFEEKRQGMVNFERELHYAGFQIHYLQKTELTGNQPNVDMVSDIPLFASYREVDAVILLTTQGQFAPLPEKLKDVGVPTLLLGWNFCYEKENRWVHWKTDSLLKQKSAYYIAMEHVANKNPPSPLSDFNLFKIQDSLFKKHAPRILPLKTHAQGYGIARQVLSTAS